jgi:hypothetical protein
MAAVMATIRFVQDKAGPSVRAGTRLGKQAMCRDISSLQMDTGLVTLFSQKLPEVR